MPYEKAHAITIRRADFSETSYVIAFYTREYGRLSALAKGAKRKYSKLIGHIDLFSYGQIVFASGWTRDRLHILSEACAFETFPSLRDELPRYYAACHAAQLLYAMTAVEDRSPELFDEMLGLLRRVEEGVDPALALFAFEARLLVLTGFMPEVSRCVVSGEPVRGKQTTFSLRLGGVLSEESAAGETDVIEKVPTGALALLGRLAQGKLTRLDRVSISKSAAQALRSFLNEYETYVLSRPMRTAKHLSD